MRPLNEIRNYMGNYHVKSGVYHYYRNEFTQALTFLQKALGDEDSLDPEERRNARCYLALSLKSLGQRLAAEGDAAAGLVELDRAAEVRPDFPDIQFLRGQMLELNGRRDAAIAVYRLALERHPAFLDAWVALGICLSSAKRAEDAAAAFREALGLRLRTVREPFEAGLAELDNGRTEAGLALMREVFGSDPRLAETHLASALELLRAEDFERALEELDRALGFSPKYPDLHNFRGIALCGLERPLDAVESFHRAAELCPEQVVPRLNRAFAYLRAGQEEEAEMALESVLATRPNEPVASAKLAELRGRGNGARTAAAKTAGRRSVGGAR